MNIGVWGLGNHAINNILPALKKSSDLKLTGVYTRDKSIKSQYAKYFNCKTWSSHLEMLEDPDIDILYLSTPPALHYQSGIEILSAGKHFWCEKPFTMNLEHTKDLIELSNEKNLTVAEGFMYLYHPQLDSLKKELKKYKSNEIKYINCIFTLPHTETPGFRYNLSLGGSTLLDIGTYNISLVLEILGQENYKILHKKSYIDDSSKVDMYGFAVIKFDSGAICNLFWGMGFGYRNEIDILTTKSSIFTDKIFSKKEGFSPRIIVRNQIGDVSYIECLPDNHFVSMFKHFKSILDDEKKAKAEKERIFNLAKLTEEIRSN
tara:strand:+ start:362 stop:1318 length:957 start_codon:yes stop_codon:yes gene_type:complete